MADPQTKARVIAVEEHIVGDKYLDETEHLEIGPGEELEQLFMSGFNTDPKLRRRIVDLDGRMAEMDKSGTDVAVLSLNPPGVQFFRDDDRATALAREMNGATRPGRRGGWNRATALAREMNDGLGGLATRDGAARPRSRAR